jgi:DNA repair protein RadA/Sms
MSKAKIKYVCNNCGYESPTWLGKCPSCGEWNTFTEEKVVKRTARRTADYASEPVKLSGEVSSESERVLTGIAEFDRTLGGGFMPGSLVLIGGDPGIGKSTLVMQAAAKSNIQTLYVTGEESVNQINLRAKRLKIKAENISLLAETNYEEIENAALKLKPDLLIIDSIQTVYDPRIENAPGTVTQLREVTANLMRLSKTKNITTLIIGHVTKDGFIAGPKILEHIVDTVLQFEGEKNHAFRILRALKNRFGNTNEIGVFEMTERGLRQVENPSEIFLSQKEKELPGSVITASLEGSRAVLIEVQALTTRTNYGNPQRVATGFDYKRLAILLAVLDKRAELRTGYYNVFVNIAGGLKIFEPAIDLAVCVAIASSMNDKVISSDTLFIGEVGLGGEIRIVSNAEKRIAEAEKLGLKKIFLPKGNLKNIKTNKAELIPVNDISDVFYKLGIK